MSIQWSNDFYAEEGKEQRKRGKESNTRSKWTRDGSCSAGIQNTLPTVPTGIPDHFFLPPARKKFARIEAPWHERKRWSMSATAKKNGIAQGNTKREGWEEKETAVRGKGNFTLRGMLIPFDVRFHRKIAPSYISLSRHREFHVGSSTRCCKSRREESEKAAESPPCCTYRWFDESQDYLRKCSNSSSAVEQSTAAELSAAFLRAELVSRVLRDGTWERGACIL